MKYCKKCLQPDTRPGIKFSDDGVCYGCVWEEEKKKIDWDLRHSELLEISERAKKKAKERNIAYDCVIGVSGGKDSHFQAFYARDVLGLKVLLVNSVPEGLTEVGRHNIENLINHGFDVIHLRPDPQMMKKLVKKSFFENGNPVKPTEYSLWGSAYQIAYIYKIPLIIQGENAGLTMGVANAIKLDGNAFNQVTTDTLQGCNASDWVSDEISERDLYLLQFPYDVLNTDIEAIFLQFYVNEWSQVGNTDFAIARGIWGRTREDLHDLGRYRRYTALDSDMVIMNQMLKYLKFGFGFATDEACYDIREGRLTREQAIWYVKEYDGLCGEQYIQEFCDYIDITVETFWEVADQFVNKGLFYKNEQGKWTPKFEVGVDFDEA